MADLLAAHLDIDAVLELVDGGAGAPDDHHRTASVACCSWWAGCATVAAALLLAACGQTVAGTPTRPGATLEKVTSPAPTSRPACSSTASHDKPDSPDGAGGPGRCCPCRGLRQRADRRDRQIRPARPRQRHQARGSYDGVRIVMTVLSWLLDLQQLEATANRCAKFEAFFDPNSEGIPSPPPGSRAPSAGCWSPADDATPGCPAASTWPSKTSGRCRRSESRSPQRIRQSKPKRHCRRRFGRRRQAGSQDSGFLISA